LKRKHDYNEIESEDYYDMACEWKKQKEYVKAEDCLEKVISLNRKFIYAYIDLAELYALRKKFHDAVHLLKKAAKNDPEFDLLYYLMAKYAYKAGDFRNALSDVEQAIDINPTELYIRVHKVIREEYIQRRL